jgi:hypothetical protein
LGHKFEPEGISNACEMAVSEIQAADKQVTKRDRVAVNGNNNALIRAIGAECVSAAELPPIYLLQGRSARDKEERLSVEMVFAPVAKISKIQSLDRGPSDR